MCKVVHGILQVGLDFFYNFSDEKPAVVICTDQELVYVFDDRHLDEISNINIGEHIMLLKLTFEKVFDNKCTWTTLKEEYLKESIKERNIKS